MIRHLAISLTLAVLLVALSLAVGRILPGDAALSEALTGFGGSTLALVSRLSSLTVWTALVVILAVVLWLSGRPRTGLLLLAAVVTAEVAALVLKELVDRPRPTVGAAELAAVTASFPSSSVVRVTVTLGVLVATVAWRREASRLPSLVLTLLFLAVLGIARIASGEHWPSDVLGGYLLGGLWLEGLALLSTYRVRRSVS
ncbi:MAG TPA: phosphatase PAP2 family protein [Chloroflexota bacterium]|nr:phosphatase PAP2 family protein [Chloroflexota bacterium]